jgi:ubiquitin-like protein Pup
MSEQQKNSVSNPADETTEAVELPTARPDFGSDVDDILGEIDDVLEENAEEFVRSYVQKGGE